MEIKVKLEELDRLISQWDEVEGCKRELVLLLCGIYGNPLNLDLASLEKPEYREVPKKGIIREGVEQALKIIGMLCLGVCILGAHVEDGIFMLFGIPGFVFFAIWALLYEAYSRKCSEADKYNRSVDRDYSKHMAETYESMIKIHTQEMLCGVLKMTQYEMQELEKMSDELRREEERLGIMFAASGIASEYRKREHLVFLYDTLAWQEVESWEGALHMLEAEVKNSVDSEKKKTVE